MKIIPENLIIEMIDKKILINNKSMYANTPLLNKEFWNAVQIPRKTSETSAKSLIKKILTIVETMEEVDFFKNLLPQKFKYFNTSKSITQEVFLYYLWEMATVKVAKDCSLILLPPIAIEHFMQSQSQIHLIGWLNLLQKYKMDEVKSYIIDIYNKAEQEEVVNIAKNILIKNNIIEKKEETLNLIEEEEILYKNTMFMSVNYFKEKVNNNNLLTDYLISLVVSAFEERIKIEYEIKSHNVQFNFVSENKENNNKIRKDILSALDFAFSGNFSHHQKISKMKNMKERTNLIYSYARSGKDLLSDFKKEMDVFLLKEKIETELNMKETNESKKRNKQNKL